MVYGCDSCDTDCSRTLFLWSFWLVTSVYILLAILYDWSVRGLRDALQLVCSFIPSPSFVIPLIRT